MQNEYHNSEKFKRKQQKKIFDIEDKIAEKHDRLVESLKNCYYR